MSSPCSGTVRKVADLRKENQQFAGLVSAVRAFSAVCTTGTVPIECRENRRSSSEAGGSESIF